MKIHRFIAAAAALAFASGQVFAQAYPTTNPTYIPTAVLAPTTLTATGDVDIVLQNLSTLVVKASALTGTLAASVQVSNDPPATSDASSTWTTMTASPTAGGAGITSITANGKWVVPVGGFTKARIHVTTLSGGGATVTFNASGTSSLGAADVCQNPGITKSSAIVNVGAAATTKIVDTLSTTIVSVCSFNATLAGTTPTVVFKTGTHASADCDTSAASLTGVYAPTTGSVLSAHGPGTLFTSIAGGQICATTVGTGSSFQGLLTYVQQ